MEPVIESISEKPDPAGRALILSLLDADSMGKSSWKEGDDFAVLIRDPATDEIVGGLWGQDDFGWAYVRYLYVPPALRGQRIGERLMVEAEAIARQRRMVGIWLGTFDFQARGFYEKLGYAVFGSLESIQEASGQFFLKKRLSSSKNAL